MKRDSSMAKYELKWSKHRPNGEKPEQMSNF